MPKKKEQLTLDDIIHWVLDHANDQVAMDTISNLVFPNTTKYKQRYSPNNNRTRSSGDDF